MNAIPGSPHTFTFPTFLGTLIVELDPGLNPTACRVYFRSPVRSLCRIFPDPVVMVPTAGDTSAVVLVSCFFLSRSSFFPQADRDPLLQHIGQQGMLAICALTMAFEASRHQDIEVLIDILIPDGPDATVPDVVPADPSVDQQS